jgi:predicted RNA-binding protein (virulence factor B family)
MQEVKKSKVSKIVKNPDLVEDPAELVGMCDIFKVVSATEFGAFLDWGFPKDLFVPWVEQHRRMKEGESYIVHIYRDKADRFAASSKLDKFLAEASADVKDGDIVDLLICDETPLGYKAVVNNAYWGLLYKQEVFQPLRYGQRLEGFVKKVRADGKIDLCLQKPGYEPVGSLSQKILAHLKASGGSSPLTDKTPPEEIYQLFGVSKKKFKMAVGLLYKERAIAIEKSGIKLVQKKI